MRKLLTVAVGLCLVVGAGCDRRDIRGAKELLYSAAEQYELVDLEFAELYRKQVYTCMDQSYDWNSYDNCIAGFEAAAQLVLRMRVEIFYAQTQLHLWENGGGSKGFREAACQLYNSVSKLRAFFVQHGVDFATDIKGLRC